MEQAKINKLIEFNWDTEGIKKIDPSLYDDWKEFVQFVGFDSKSKQAVNSYINTAKSFNSIDLYKQELNKKEITMADNFEANVFDQMSIIILQIAENYLNSSEIKNLYIRVEKFFNFLWYCLYPLFFYKSFIFLIQSNAILYPGQLEELSNEFYGYVVDEKNIKLNKIKPSTKYMIIIVANLLDAVKK